MMVEIERTGAVVATVAFTLARNGRTPGKGSL
jgi:hypothetical protein